MKNLFSFFFLFVFFSVSAQENISDYLTKKGSGGKNTFAVIIANEDYQSYSDGYTENEELAIYQAERFEQMLIKQVGIPKENITFYPDAINTHIKLAIAKLQKILTPNSKIIFYFRGKTFQSDPEGELFLVPIDSDGQETFFMFGLEDLRKRLGSLNVSSVDIFIDALPDKSSGTLAILENGFVKLSSPPPVYKNMIAYRVKPPVAKPEQVQPPSYAFAKKPEIKIVTPDQSTETYGSNVLVSGKITSECPIQVVAVNGEEAGFREDGSFIARVVLEEGENNIAVEAKNCVGWTRDIILVTKLSLPVDSAQVEPAIDSLQMSESSIMKSAGKNYALLIGISKYQDGVMPDLFYPIKDASKIKEVLISHYAFDPKNVIFLQNPVKAIIIKTLDSLNRILKPEDSFLMFYAGHGTWDEKTRMGYWLPSDAAARVLDNWIMNSIITNYISVIPAKHTLIIADACFAGSIFRTRAFIPPEEKTIAELFGKSSRKAMTSGDMTEVPDESIFLRYFLKKLEDNTENYVSSEKLFFDVKPQVVNDANLIPQFGIIKNSGDEGGDFIFFKKQ
jgi:hypothetical protein